MKEWRRKGFQDAEGNRHHKTRRYTRIKFVIMSVTNESILQNINFKGYFNDKSADQTLEAFIDKELKWPFTEYKLIGCESGIPRVKLFKLVSPATPEFIEEVMKEEAKVVEEKNAALAAATRIPDEIKACLPVSVKEAEETLSTE